jgi:hypothetical protein
VCPYPEEVEVHNKPIGLNAAVEMLYELQIPFAWVGVADAEDLFHPDLLKLVDYRFHTTYLFSPRQARRLTVNSPFVPVEDRRLAEAAGVPAIAD